MKKTGIITNRPAVNPGKIILLLAITACISTNGLMAQERGHQQGNNNRGQGQASRQQGNNGNRPPVTAPPVQRGDRGTNGNNQGRPPGNVGVSRPVTSQPVSRPNPVQHTNRQRPVIVNNNRTSVTVVNNANRRYNPRPVYNAKNPSWHYANVPRRNTVINTVPAGYSTIHFGTYDYRYHNGVFYRPVSNTFMVVAPPVGLHISILPVGYRRIYVHNLPYYYYNGTYYDYRDNNYLVVSPPVGAIVESLPAGYETLTIDGETYYTVDGAQYKPVVQENGEIWYEVVKAN